MTEKEKELRDTDYKFLGWQNSWQHVMVDSDYNPVTDKKQCARWGYKEEEHPEFVACMKAKHKHSYINDPTHRGLENIGICHQCRIYWKYDSSD